MKRKNPLSENATKGDILKLEFKLTDLEQRIDNKAQGYRDQVLTSNDKLAKTLETIREDLEIGNFQMKREINNHDKRIKNIEKIQQTP